MLGLIANWLLAAVFLQALDHKLVSAVRFRASLSAYGVLPGKWVGTAWLLLVIAEACTAAGLIMQMPGAAWFAVVLLLTYTGAIAINLVRGKRWLDCGCGDEPTPISAWLLIRNGLLMGLAVIGALQPFRTDWPLDATLLALLAAGFLFSFYNTTNVQLANAGKHARTWTGQTS